MVELPTSVSSFWIFIGGVGGIIGIVGIVVSIIGIVVSIRLRNRQILKFSVSSVNLIKNEMTNIPGIQITFDGEQITELISTTIKIINTGNTTITPNNFAFSDPLAIKTSGQFFGAKDTNTCYVASGNPNTDPKIKPIANNHIRIEFEFFKPKQGITITLLHSGIVHVCGELIEGTITQDTYLPPFQSPPARHHANTKT